MNMYTPTPDFYNDYISHHGVRGQKWGVKNGPPYPLDSSVSTGSKIKQDRINGDIQKKRLKLNKDFPQLQKYKIKNDEDANMYWLNEVEASSDLSPKEFKKMYPKNYSTLMKEVQNKSLDWYNGVGVSKNGRSIIEKQKRLENKYKNDTNKYSLNSDYRKEREKIYDEACGIVLDDLGYENTKKNRRWIRPVVIWD